MDTSPILWGILNVVSNEIVWAGTAPTKDDALELARVALDRVRIPASWHAQEVESDRPDRQAQVAAWLAAQKSEVGQ